MSHIPRTRDAKAHCPALILLFAKKFFRGPSRTGGFRNRFTANARPKKLKSWFSATLANEADRFEYSGSWLRPEGLSDSPFSRLHRWSEHGHSACAPSGHYVRLLFSGVGTPLGAQTTSLCSIAKRLACGKSYPVTAAQLLRLHTGFLAPIHCFKLAKN